MLHITWPIHTTLWGRCYNYVHFIKRICSKYTAHAWPRGHLNPDRLRSHHPHILDIEIFPFLILGFTMNFFPSTYIVKEVCQWDVRCEGWEGNACVLSAIFNWNLSIPPECEIHKHCWTNLGLDSCFCYQAMGSIMADKIQLEAYF